MQLFNSMTKKKEAFTPLVPGRVGLYACGITAYDYCHIGHARSSVVFDTLVRYLRKIGNTVTFVRNFTDIDDKIIKRAARENTTERDIADTYIQAFYDDMDALRIQRADHEPKATEFVQEMIDLAATLIERGHAYATPSGDVYFRVRSFDGYGKLSGRNIEEMRSGARIAPGEEKEDPLDFALWKGAKPGEPTWESPWGPGRPGWHLECSAMSEKLLGIPFDIHGGGQDLLFPHHENELAQSEAATGKEFARFWVHNGFVQINSEKMSKSLGNFITIRDIFKLYLPEVLRFFLLTTHYRSPLDYSDAALSEAEKGIKRIYQTLAAIDEASKRTKWSGTPLPDDMRQEYETHKAAITESLEDDLNTAAALGHIFSLVRLAGRILDDKALKKSGQAKDLTLEIRDTIRGLADVFAVFDTPPAEFLENLKSSRAKRHNIDPAAVEALIQKRQDARKAKDFAASDAIRDELAAMHVEVKDTPEGTVWDVM
ncbi:cysteine--tRNA ligase [Desulfovibrio inopinatus]|uniref:cysteine--tRNA ligase n=1 Tax=Desulfovibrio inopinatus TaxID=102109 RepID=UPI000410DBA2|nr:cysteine--tRNA ligase [Desulfovibrio inopinatus]